MGDSKLKLTVNGQTFEAEGDSDTVSQLFQTWKQMVESAPPPAPVLPSPPPAAAAPAAAPVDIRVPDAPDAAVTSKIFRREGPVVSLTVLPGSNADAALLILLGQRMLANEEQLTGVRLLQGMERSGLTVPRADRLFGEYMPSLVIRAGKHRGVRYRLTNQGVTKAQEIMNTLAALVG